MRAPHISETQPLPLFPSLSRVRDRRETIAWAAHRQGERNGEKIRSSGADGEELGGSCEKLLRLPPQLGSLPSSSRAASTTASICAAVAPRAHGTHGGGEATPTPMLPPSSTSSSMPISLPFPSTPATLPRTIRDRHWLKEEGTRSPRGCGVRERAHCRRRHRR